jgi:hypothetical protein
MKRFCCALAAGFLALALAAPAHAQGDTGMELGVKGMLLPTGTLFGEATRGLFLAWGDTDAALAGGVSPFVDFRLDPYISLGLGPEFIFGVKPSDSDSEPGTLINVNARIKLGAPASQMISLYALVTPGWSIILLPDAAMDAGLDDPTGFEIGFAGGVQANFDPRLGAFFELGYQWGYQNSSKSTPAGTAEFTGVNYLMLNLGIAIRP